MPADGLYRSVPRRVDVVAMNGEPYDVLIHNPNSGAIMALDLTSLRFSLLDSMPQEWMPKGQQVMLLPDLPVPSGAGGEAATAVEGGGGGQGMLFYQVSRYAIVMSLTHH